MMSEQMLSQRRAPSVRAVDAGVRRRALGLTLLMLLSLFAGIDLVSEEVSAASDADGDGLTYGLEYLINTSPNDPDSDNDGLPDGWEWMHGLDPLSSTFGDGAVGDPDGDGMSNLQEYTYLMPTGWDIATTPAVLDNGVWWNGTVPTNDWSEETAMQFNPPACGAAGSDGTGSVILCDEDPVGNICADGFDNDKDGAVDGADSDGDGDADCLSDDDDGDGLIDEDRRGYDTDGDGMPDGWEVSYGLNATSASNDDGPNGDPDNDGLPNLFEYINPSWTTNCGSSPCFRPEPGTPTETITPCDPVSGIGPGGCATLTAEVDGITSTNPTAADSDGDGLNDSYEAFTLLTDPTASDTDGDGLSDGVEVSASYGNPPQASDPRNNNTDGDAFDDGDEDANGNGLVDSGETDPTRREDAGDEDNDGIQNWEENLTCTKWDVADTDYGGVNDGDERNVSHGTDPCDSLVDYVTTQTNWNGVNRLTLTDASGFNPDGGTGWYNVSGTWASFAYGATVNNVLVGVSLAPPPSVTDVANRNGSFCHTDATLDGTISSTRLYCDDDYTDSDADGLADWEELLGVFGWFSNPTLADTDGDGVNDFGEVVRDNTDPLDACKNALDPDGDGLNTYFENSTGCTLDSIGILNGSSDVWVTDPTKFDTDSGGVNDLDEYFDGTNPENDPSDDILPDDFDGDGIPDAFENLTGTDWRNPDTDGGGVIDGVECPANFWATGCVGAPQDPLDPSDDFPQSQVIFWANNTSGTVDLEQVHRWRQVTNDFPTGSTYAHLATVHPSNELFPNIENLSGMADLGFSNSTVIWNVQYNTEFTGTPVPVPLSTINHSFWADATAELSRTNDTFIVNVDAGFLQSLIAVAPEYWFDWDTLASTTIANQSDTYTLQLDDRLANRSNPWSIAINITEAVVAEAGVSDAWSTADAIATFLREGNATTEFKRNYNGSGLPGDQDVAVHLLEVANEGTCQEFTTTFVTMARLAGLPARSVSGFAGGTWTGSGYAVTNDDRTTWAEVHLQQDAANGDTDMGWVPFEACPDAELLEIVNQSLTPLSWERNGQTWFNVSGQLRYADNSTPVADQPLVAFFVPIGEVGNVPGIAATPERQIGSAFTDANGSFNISGIPPQPIAPGFAGIVIQHVEQGYVSNGGIPYATAINVSDNTTLTHQGPTPINAPIVGAGATTEITGLLQAETIPQNVFQNLEGLEVWLSFTSSVEGNVNLSTPVNPDGSWVFDLTLNEFESKTNISALIGFSGWTDTSVPITGDVHLRPSTTGLVLDVRDAPNLTATLEGPGSNVSVLDLGDDIWVNGTVVSFGLAPASMNGSLVLSLRDIASGGGWVDVFNVTVNGTFSVQHTLNASTTPIAAGEVEPRLRFFPEVLPTTDIENLSDNAPYRLRGIYNYTMISESQLRGEATNTQFQVVDHLGNGVGIVMLGTYDVFFNGSLATSIVDPLSNQISPTWNLDATLRAGDYPLAIEFGGSDDYVPSMWNSSLRVMAEISWNFTVADDWVHIGNSTQFFGNLSDAVYGDRVLNNGSALSILMATAEGPVDLAIGSLNTSTGGFSFNVTAPTIFAGGVYEVQLLTDFLAFAPEGGPYYQFVDPNGPQGPPTGITLNWGIESEVIVTPELESIQVLIGDTIDLRARITDIADGSDLEGATVEWFLDWNGANTSLGTAQTLADGNASVQWTANSLGPGYYDIGVVVADDVTDPIAPGNRRHFGNTSLVNATVQTESVVVIDVAPSVVAADSTFNVLGRVLDADDNTRPINGLLRLDAYWDDEPGELLITGAQTAANGSFNLSLTSDAFNDGTTRGNRTLLVQIIEDSSPFYLPSNTTTDMLVQGVTDFEQLLPRNAVIINRGRSVNLSAQLVEASDLFTPLGGETVAVKVHETWHTEVQTDGEGFANTSFLFDLNHPLGIITVEFHYNGSFDLLNDRANLSTVTVRSTTVLLIDPITANPTSASNFNVTGTVLSDNGSGLESRDGSVLPANVLFAIDGQPVGFTVTGGSVGVGGAWTATITLGQTFERGSHNISATYVPSVNFYVGSNDTAPFDSRGTTSVFFLDPVLDGLGSPSLNDRTERGSDMDVRVMVQDNTGAPVANADVLVTLIGSDGPLTVPVTLTLVTDASGMAQDVMTLPANLSVGEATLTADYGGLPGTTGLVGSNTTTRFVVLASTEIVITEAPVSLIAGDAFDVRGTLLDDLGLPLAVDGTPSLAIVHLLVDGVPVSSVETDASNGSFLLSYVLPQGTDPGLHQISVQFKGGRDWVDPIGVGDPANPEYYLPTQTDVGFNVSMPSKIILTSGSGDVDRESTITISGVLLSQVDDAIGGATIEVWLDGAFLTNVTTDANGSFTALHPVPADQRLGATDMEVRFTGNVLYLPSNATGYWNVYAPILVTVELDDVIAVADQVEITGQVVDNQLQGLADHVIFLEVDGVNIGEVTTSSDGTFTYTWLVPDIFVFGDHVMVATADSQGWYRAGSGNASFYLSHRSAISISFDGDDEVTRGDLWRISGRLYDVDDAAQAGLPGRDVQVYLDGELVTVATTLEDGSWLATVPVELDLTRGEHDLEVRFAGELAHRPTDASTVGTVWANVVVTIDAVSDRTAVRSDALRTLILTGSVTEVGGEGEVFEDLDLTLSNGTGCTSASSTPTCYTLERVQWNDGNFSMTLLVPSWNPLGVQPFHVGSNTNTSRNLNSGSAVTFALIKVDATIQVRIDNIVEDDKEDFSGSILVTADDTGEGISDVGFSLYLEYANGSRVVQDGSTQQLLKRVVVTGSDGSVDYEFNHDPPYGDASEFGELTLLVLLDAGGERLTDATLATFQAEAAEGFGPDYSYSDEASSVTRTLVGALVLLVVGLLAGLVLYRRRQQATLMEEAAEVFAYTAELLAAGDSVREAIFQCYTDLCVVLQKREFLRRDFETVREFEAAIRQAMPAVSEEALVGLDNVFEQARYGRDEMSEGHAQAAKVAMERMATEVTSIQKIIPRGL
jgi:transglutaminase-like putative cysteine protease